MKYENIYIVLVKASSTWEIAAKGLVFDIALLSEGGDVFVSDLNGVIPTSKFEMATVESDCDVLMFDNQTDKPASYLVMERKPQQLKREKVL